MFLCLQITDSLFLWPFSVQQKVPHFGDEEVECYAVILPSAISSVQQHLPAIFQ